MGSLLDIARGGMMGLSTDVLGTPVDLLTALLRPLGYKTEKPVMGSDWLADKLGVKQTGSIPEQAARFATGLLSPGPGEMAQGLGLLGAIKAPKALFRGTGPNSGTNPAQLGKGLYSSPSKKFAAMYGDVSSISVSEAFPQNPLVIPGAGRGDAHGIFNDWVLEKTGLPNMREFNKRYPDPGQFVRSLGYDGVWIGDEIVKY